MLANIADKSLVRRVYEQARQAQKLDQLIVATDHPEIFEHVKSFQGNVVMTREQHQSGTDRCFEAWEKTPGDYDFVVNIQGDEPFISPSQIDELVNMLQPDVQLATLAMQAHDSDTLFSPSEVKIALNKNQEAIYFSRQAIPYQRGNDAEIWINNFDYLLHIGIYAYRADVLRQISQLQPSPLERAEALEQLRWLEHGYRIRVGLTNTHPGMPIDTEADLLKAEAFIRSHPQWS